MPTNSFEQGLISKSECELFLQLSSAEHHEALRERLISVIQQLLPNAIIIIFDNTLEKLVHSDAQRTPIDQMHSIHHSVQDAQDSVIGEINIYNEQAITEKYRAIINILLELYGDIHRLLNLSHYDPLTQTQNRLAFDLHINNFYKQALAAKRRQEDDNNQHILTIIDLDHFKRINDNYGHLVGDEVLILTAQLINNSLRDSDKIFRFGGEEFILLLHNCSLSQAKASLIRIAKTVNDFSFPQGANLTVSMGYCQVDTQVNYDVLIERADAALYYVKAHGRNNQLSYEQLLEQGHLQAINERSGEIELF